MCRQINERISRPFSNLTQPPSKRRGPCRTYKALGPAPARHCRAGNLATARGLAERVTCPPMPLMRTQYMCVDFLGSSESCLVSGLVAAERRLVLSGPFS